MHPSGDVTSEGATLSDDGLLNARKASASVDDSASWQFLPTFLFLTSFAVNICTLGLFGLHWLYLALNGPKDCRKHSFFHFLSYIFSAGLTSLGAWCRSSASGVLDCPNGEEMSVECLYNIQPKLYQFVYTIHYFGLAWIALHFVMDTLHMPCWIVDIYKKKATMSMYYSGYGMHGGGDGVSITNKSNKSTTNVDIDGDNGPINTIQFIFKKYFHPRNYTYFHWLLLVWISMKLTWTMFVNWSTGDANGVQGLAIAEFSQICVYFVLIYVYYYVSSLKKEEDLLGRSIVDLEVEQGPLQQ